MDAVKPVHRSVYVLGVLVGLALASLPWIRLNVSPSVPVGLYRLHPVPQALQVGDLVLVDVPAVMRPWWPRLTPLLKPVAGVAGDNLTIADGRFYINTLDYGPVYAMAEGKALPQVASPTIVQAGEVCLASRVPKSLDCRYSGPIPFRAIRALVTPLWVRKNQ